MARKTREETENTRAQILQSALDCFYEKGFSRTTFEDIAARINLTKGDRKSTRLNSSHRQ